ncbi:MAG: SDR family oxidoreductase [Proteobacteria bacterium]|nr:SDR family oxidoreductase [Pseudomonadota bacterium]
MAGEPRKLALVTGAARGLGRHLCLRLAAAGYDILINYLSSEAAAAKLAAGLGELGAAAWTQRADVSREDQVAALFAAADGTGRELALVINNVGIYNPIALREIDSEQWQRTIATNLNGAFHVCRQALGRLRAGGQIINIGVAGNQLNQAEGSATDYYISKAALLQLTRALAAEYAPDGVRLNMVSPGQLANSIGELGGAPGRVPLGRDGSFEDVWQAIDYLLGADYVTGANIEVAGGYRL